MQHFEEHADEIVAGGVQIAGKRKGSPFSTLMDLGLDGGWELLTASPAQRDRILFGKVMKLARPFVQSWLESQTREQLTQLLDDLLSGLDEVRYADQSTD